MEDIVGVDQGDYIKNVSEFYPRLKLVTKKYKAAPASSVSSERVFSLYSQIFLTVGKGFDLQMRSKLKFSAWKCQKLDNWHERDTNIE